jgi:PAS domain S-box-containing protein
VKTNHLNHATRSAIASEGADIGYWCMDMVYNHLYWSDETYRIFGTSKDRFLPCYRTFYKIIHPDDRADWTADWNLFIQGSIPMNIEHRILLPTGEIRYVHQSGERIVDRYNRLIWISGTVRDITGFCQVFHQEKDINHQVGDRQAKRSILAQIASIGKPVSVLVRKSCSVVVDLTAGLIKLHKIVIADSAADLNLKSAIEMLLSRLVVAKPMTIAFDAGMFYERGLSKKVKLSILRVIQEHFNNIAKYADASEVYVSLRRTRQRAYLVIHDNGQGFDMTQRRNGLFITDIIECAEMNNGKATIKSGPGMGCRLRAEFTTDLPKGGA